MTRFSLITWNIQWGRGCDGVVDLRRIVETARALADFDVLCLQEVASNFPQLAGNTSEDQPQRLAQLLPGYTPVYGAATDVLAADGARALFGNMILTRLPVIQVFRHLLPWRAEPGKRSMQRGLVEAVIETPFGAIRVMTTHLEYYSPAQRAAQVERIRELHADAAWRARHGRAHGAADGPFRRQRGAVSAILTADFNFRPDDPLHDRLMAPSGTDVPAFHDAWQVRHPDMPHPPSIGLFDRKQWPKGAFCCDFIYVTEDLCPRVAAVEIDQQSAASDHQAVVLTLDAATH
jgi:endonuclease/exonuclease/phosphatase family metal-dependent hydrolase